MIIQYNPYEWTTVIEHVTCGFHKKHPFRVYAGCTCTSTYTIKHEPNWDKVMEDIFEEYDEVFKRLADM